MKAVVLLSGGIDSSTTLAFAKVQGFETYAISFDYSQRHQIELEASRRVATALGVKRHLIIKFDMRQIGGSALTSEIDVPKADKMTIPAPLSLVPSTRDIPITYVPVRNTIFLSFALAWAEVVEASEIFIGANAIDYSGYPDCRPEYLMAFQEMANLATKASVEGRISFKINAPLLNMTKAEIIRLGLRLGLDYSLTWSCYDPQFKDNKFFPCELCDSCLFRKKGFHEAGIEDPLQYLKCHLRA